MIYHDLNSYILANVAYSNVGLTCINGDPFIKEEGKLIPYKEWKEKNTPPVYQPLPRVSANGNVNYSGIITVDHIK